MLQKYFSWTVALLLGLLQSITSAQQSDLATAFATPPDSAKPHTWWHWMNGNVTREGITLDLEAMHRVGLGGFQLFQVGSGIPAGPAPFGSPQNTDLVKFAIREADRLGLECTFHNCSGWSSSGGTWITPELSMKVLTFTETPIPAGQKADLNLPQPTAQQNFYRDVIVLAFPAPAAPEARIANWATKSGYPGGGGGRGRGAPTGPTTNASADSAAIDPLTVLDLSKKMDAQGHFTWDPPAAPAGNWTILRLGYTTTGSQNRPAPDGATGLECDKFSREAFDFHFNHFFGDLYDSLKPLAAKGKAGALIDSYEAGLQNWTQNFPQEFLKRRGYDLTPWLPAMTGRVVGSLDLSERFLWDIRKTQAELMAENYYGRFIELCREHGFKSYIEPYDPGNFDEMTVGAYPDAVMGEFWQGQANQHSIKLVASVAHVNAKTIVGAESFTSQSRWTEYPYALKALGDFMYAQGLNRYIFHRFAMQPNPTALPGMTMGPWGGHFDRTNTWFEQAKPWLTYCTRSQFLLQQGLFAADLLYFAGEDSPARAPDKAALNPPPPPGYDYDTADPGTIMKRIRIDNGRIVLPDGMTYRAFVLTNKRTITLELLRKIHDLVDQGMSLIVSGPKPAATPGLTNYPNADKELQRLAADLWGDLNGTTLTERPFGNGKIFWGQPTAEVLAKLGAKPDFEFSARSGNADINHIHRRIGDAEVYFVANRGQRSEDLVCTFNISGRQPEFWDADSASITPAMMFDFADGRTQVPIRLDPAGSVFVVFRTAATSEGSMWLTKEDGSQLFTTMAFKNPQQPAPAQPNAPRAGQMAMALPAAEAPPMIDYMGAGQRAPLAWENGKYALYRSQRQAPTPITITGIAPPTEITGPWHITFPPKRGAPAEATFDKLISWSDSPDTGIKYFSGTATYTKKFTVPADSLGADKRLFLDLGRVLVVAEVIINGKNLGILWKLPFRTDITDAVHAGDNDLEIRVTNLWPNRLIGDEQLPPDNQYVGFAGNTGRGTRGGITQLPKWFSAGQPKPDSPRITFTTWHHWNANDPLLESGLIGPVLLRSAVRITPP